MQRGSHAPSPFSSKGVQSQTRVLRRLGVPILCFVNRVDRVGAHYQYLLESLERQVDLRTLAMSTVTGAGTKATTVDALDFAFDPSRSCSSAGRER